MSDTHTHTRARTHTHDSSTHTYIYTPTVYTHTQGTNLPKTNTREVKVSTFIPAFAGPADLCEIESGRVPPRPNERPTTNSS